MMLLVDPRHYQLPLAAVSVSVHCSSLYLVFLIIKPFLTILNGIFDLRKNKKSAGKTANKYFLICCRAVFADHFPPGFAFVAQFQSRFMIEILNDFLRSILHETKNGHEMASSPTILHHLLGIQSYIQKTPIYMGFGRCSTIYFFIF